MGLYTFLANTSGEKYLRLSTVCTELELVLKYILKWDIDSLITECIYHSLFLMNNAEEGVQILKGNLVVVVVKQECFRCCSNKSIVY